MEKFDSTHKTKPAASPSTTPADSGENSKTRHCFVLCKTVQPGDLTRAHEVVANVFGHGYSATISKHNSIIVLHGQSTVGILGHIPAPIPHGEAENAADHNYLWINGKTEAAKHLAHVIVTNIGAAAQTPVQSALDVTRLALVALQVYDGIGVYWGNAQVSNSREVFESCCQGISDHYWPVPIWLRFQFVRASIGIGMYTLGMKQFDLMDIEVESCNLKPEKLCDFVSNLALYLIKNGPIIEDGNTIGSSAEERILIRHRPSMLDKDRKVYKIIFDESLGG